MKNGSITGMASFCFTCDQFKFFNPMVSSENFGEAHDYEKLKTYLEKAKTSPNIK